MLTKTRKCKVCRAEYQPIKPLQKVCGYDCALSLATSNRAKEEKVARVKEKRQDKVKREAIKSRSDWLREAQTSFNAFIRARDFGKPCISCGRYHQGQYHAGHYLSVGARPELRFCEANVHKQCSACNNYLSGSIVLYRIALIDKIGQEMVDWLEGPHEAKKYTVDELKAIKQTYTAAAKELRSRE